MNKRVGTQTVKTEGVYIKATAAIGGTKEKDGPIGDSFDVLMPDAEWGEETWEKTESKMQKEVLKIAARKAGLETADLNYIFAGDLLNQCIGAGFGFRDMNVPYYGIYGACSTMIEGIGLGAMLIGGNCAENLGAVTSSHFCTAERQYRMPLEYGGQRTPTAQWTVTGSGCTILSSSGAGPKVTHVTTGKIMDMGVKDANNMGAAMAPAALSTIKAHFEDLGKTASDYDLIVTGDLGQLGKDVLLTMAQKEGVPLGGKLTDCGTLVFDQMTQDVHSGGSGCGCSAITLCGYLLEKLNTGKLDSILFCGTGALLSPTSVQQGLPISGVCHAVSIMRG